MAGKEALARANRAKSDEFYAQLAEELSPRGQSDNAEASGHLTAAESPDMGGNRGR